MTENEAPQRERLANRRGEKRRERSSLKGEYDLREHKKEGIGVQDFMLYSPSF